MAKVGGLHPRRDRPSSAAGHLRNPVWSRPDPGLDTGFAFRRAHLLHGHAGRSQRSDPDTDRVAVGSTRVAKDRPS